MTTCPNCGKEPAAPLTTNVLGVEHCGCYYADRVDSVRCHTSDPIEQTLETMFKRTRAPRQPKQ